MCQKDTRRTLCSENGTTNMLVLDDCRNGGNGHCAITGHPLAFCSANDRLYWEDQTQPKKDFFWNVLG